MGNIQWFPGHMTRTKRKIQESLPLVDMIVEIIDARIPVSSRNPDLDVLTAGKPRAVILNKADIADERATAEWVRYFQGQGVAAAAMDCKSGKGTSAFSPMVQRVLADRIAQWKAKGMTKRPIRMMVAGIPNSGKSSFINRMSRSGKAKVEDRPGVTRGNQWYVTADGYQMLDTPGVLWPKFEDPLVGEKLAFTGAVKDGVVDIELLAMRLLSYLAANYPERLAERFKMTDLAGLSGWELLELAGRKRGMLVSGGEVNTERAAITVMDEYRGGKLGRLTFEAPPEE